MSRYQNKIDLETFYTFPAKLSRKWAKISFCATNWKGRAHMWLVILIVSVQHFFFHISHIWFYRPPGGQPRFPGAQLGSGGPREAICDHVRPPAADFGPRTCWKTTSICPVYANIWKNRRKIGDFWLKFISLAVGRRQSLSLCPFGWKTFQRTFFFDFGGYRRFLARRGPLAPAGG